jgi:ABC-type transporter Mla subunit MlaD
MSNEQGMPALPEDCFETDRPIWENIIKWRGALTGKGLPHADKIDAAITDLVHTYAREYAAQQTAEAREIIGLLSAAKDLAMEAAEQFKADRDKLQSRLDEAVAVLAVLLRAHETLLRDCKLQAGWPTKAARAFLAVQEAA